MRIALPFIVCVGLLTPACVADDEQQETVQSARRSTDREKMLLRFVVQKDFGDERARICGSHKDIADLVRSLTFSDAIVKLPKLDNSLKRKAVVLSLGIRGFGGYDVAKATEALRKTLETEKDKWVRLEIARVLSSLNNDAGKNVLIQALLGKDGYQTSSCMEVGKAAIPLLLLDYGFPLGVPTGGKGITGVTGNQRSFL